MGPFARHVSGAMITAQPPCPPGPCRMKRSTISSAVFFWSVRKGGVDFIQCRTDLPDLLQPHRHHLFHALSALRQVAGGFILAGSAQRFAMAPPLFLTAVTNLFHAERCASVIFSRVSAKAKTAGDAGLMILAHPLHARAGAISTGAAGRPDRPERIPERRRSAGRLVLRSPKRYAS